MSSELFNKLFKRRSDVESAGQTWESAPTASSADASHLESLTFNAPPAQEWLQQLEHTPEEDMLAGAIADGLEERRQALPEHLLPAVSAEEAEKLNELVKQLSSFKKSLESERDGLGEAREELLRREAEIQAREKAVEAEQQRQQKREKHRRNYPQPKWLENIEGTMNIGVVGNAGVGKSLLINKLRRVRPQAHGWAPVGVCETTMQPTRYPFPGQPKVCLWDLPGAGTAAIPSETYIQDMGLRYFDKVLILTAGRFTSMEVGLRAELEKHGVPYYMVRTKVDMDTYNNKEDNGMDDMATLTHIREDLKKKHGVSDAYLVSSRDPESYDMPNLVSDLFPGMKRQLDPNAVEFVPGAPAWNDPWAMPVVFSATVSALQGRWYDEHSAFYLVQGSQVHVTLNHGTQSALVPLTERGDAVWWCSRWYVDEKSVAEARRSAVLRWTPSSAKDIPLIWRWTD